MYEPCRSASEQLTGVSTRFSKLCRTSPRPNAKKLSGTSIYPGTRPRLTFCSFIFSRGLHPGGQKEQARPRLTFSTCQMVTSAPEEPPLQPGKRARDTLASSKIVCIFPLSFAGEQWRETNPPSRMLLRVLALRKSLD